MTYLKTLQNLMDFYFFGFFLSMIVILSLYIFGIVGSFNDLLLGLSRTGLEKHSIDQQEVIYLNVFIHLIQFALFFAILLFFRRVVDGFSVGNVFNLSTRKNLKYMGLCTTVYGLLKMLVKVCVLNMFGEGNTIFSLEFTGFGSTYFITCLGLMFIYMSIVLEKSAILQKENELTI